MRSILVTLCLILWGSIAIAQDVPRSDAVHLLFIFGTEDERCASIVVESKRRLEQLLKTTGVSPDEPFRDEKSMKRVKADQIVFLNGKGKHNIQSASPPKKERPLGTADMGTFFTNVFVNCMDRPIEDMRRFDMKSMIEELQSELTNILTETTDIENGQKNQTIMLW